MGFVFAGVSVGLFLGILNVAQRDERVANNSDLPIVTAQVIGISSTLMVNNVSYYRILFTWDDNGVTRSGRTNSAYTHVQAMQFVNNGTIEIRVDGTRAVAYPFIQTPGMTAIWVLVIVFGAVGMVQFLVAAVLAVLVIRIGMIARTGVEGMGRFIDATVGILWANGGPRHRIRFSFQGIGDIKHTNRTGSRFTTREAAAARAMQNFPIRYRGGRAVILIAPLREFMRDNAERVDEAELEGFASPYDRVLERLGRGRNAQSGGFGGGKSGSPADASTGGLVTRGGTDVGMTLGQDEQPTGVMNPGQANQVRNEIRRAPGERERMEILNHYRAELDTNTYFELRGEIHDLNVADEKRGKRNR